MPFKYVPPELFLEYKEVKIYHMYQDGDLESRLQYWYTADVKERKEFNFSVKRLAHELGWAAMNVQEIDLNDAEVKKKIIRMAIDKKIIPDPGNSDGSDDSNEAD